MYTGLFTSRRQFDLVAVGIFEEGNGIATDSMLHRAGLAYDLNPFSSKLIAGFVNVRHAERDMPKTVANVIRVRVPVIGKFNDCVSFLRPIPDKDVGKTARGIFPLLQEFHAESITVKLETLIQIIDSDHRVNDFHISPFAE